MIARPRARGNGKLRRVLTGAVDPKDVRSILEIRFLRMCAAHDIPRPKVNVRIGEWTPDFYWPEWRLIVETDSVAFHSTAWEQQRDALKDDAMRALGLEVLPAEVGRGGRSTRRNGPPDPRVSARPAMRAVEVTFVGLDKVVSDCLHTDEVSSHSQTRRSPMTSRRSIWTLAIVSVALFMVSLDNLIVTNALPVIREELGARSRASGRSTRTR